MNPTFLHPEKLLDKRSHKRSRREWVVVVRSRRLALVRQCRMRGRELYWRNCLSVALLLPLSLSLLASCGPSPGTGKLGPPQPPREVKLSMVPEGLEVSWDRISGATHYTVFWGTENGKYNQLYAVPDNRLFITGLRKGELSTVAVTSWNQNGESDYSPEAVVVYDDDPRRATAHLAKGNELLLRGSLDLADAYLSAAIRLNPNNAQAYRSRALVNEKMNRVELARKDHAAEERLIKQQKASLRQAEP